MSAIATTAVQRIQTLADELFNMGNTALEKVNEAGRLLTECKEGLAHGQWLPWLEENFTFTDRTARRWMKLHEDIVAGRLKSDTVSGLAEAYKLTTEPRFGATDKASAPAPRPAPASSKPPLPLGATYQDAEIVEPEHPVIETVSINPEWLERKRAEFREEQAAPADIIPKWIPDDADRLWLLAHIHLQKILPSDKSRERVLNEVVAYCHGQLDQKRDALAAIIGTLPRLTKAEIKSLIETLNTRWT